MMKSEGYLKAHQSSRSGTPERCEERERDSCAAMRPKLLLTKTSHVELLLQQAILRERMESFAHQVANFAALL